MPTLAPLRARRTLVVSALISLVVVLTGCTGRGGGQLPPGAGFPDAASFGFSFSCEDKGGLNPPTGHLRIQLSYTEHGPNPLGAPFSVHGTADQLDPVLESMVCIGQEPPPGGSELIFLGKYRLTSSPPAGLPETCAEASCRFEVVVRDHDRDRVPSPGDFFSITLSSVTALVSEFTEPAGVLYTRAGLISSGNITVD